MKVRHAAILVMAIAPVAALVPGAMASPVTWTGTNSNLWSDNANWTPTGPTTADTPTFDGLFNTNTVNDTSLASVAGLTWNNTAATFAIAGNALGLTGNLVDNATNAQSVGIDLTLLANVTASTATGAALTLLGNLSGAATNSFTKTGAGTLVISGNTTYLGNTFLDGGTVRFTTNNTIGNLTFGAVSSSVNVTSLDLGNATLTATNLVVRNNSASSSTVTLSATTSMSVGNVTIGGLGNNTKTLFSVTGGGSFNGTGSLFSVGSAAGGNSGNVTVTADLSAAGNVTLNYTGGNITVGAGTGAGANAPFATLNLGGNNTLTAANIMVGINNGGGNVSTSVLSLGTNNVINADRLEVGGGKSASPAVGTIKMGAASGTAVKLRGQDGTSAMGNFTISDGTFYTSSSGTAQTAVADFTGATMDAVITNLTVAIGKGGTQNTAPSNGTLTFSAGNITATNVVVSIRSTSTQSAPTTGTINANGGNFTMGSLLLANTAVGCSTGVTTGILNVNGGLVTMNGDIVGGGGVASVNLNGGTLNMNGHNFGAAAPTVALNASSGTIMNVANINANGNLTKVGTGTLSVAGSNTFTGAVVIQGGTLALTAPTSNNNVANSSKLLVGDSLANNAAILDVTGLSGGIFSLAGGQTLAGFGTVKGDVLAGLNTVLGPGNSAGTLTNLGNTSLGSGALLNFDLDMPNVAAGTGNNDLYAITGNLTIAQNVTLNVTAGANFNAGVYHLITFGTVVDNSASFTGWTATGINPSFLYSFSLSNTPNTLDLIVASAPEPTSVGVLAVGATALLVRRRRK